MAKEFLEMSSGQRRGVITNLLRGGNLLSYEQICEKLGVQRVPPQFDKDVKQIEGLGAEIWALGGTLQEMGPIDTRKPSVLSSFLLVSPNDPGKQDRYYCLRNEHNLALNKALEAGFTWPPPIQDSDEPDS